MSEPVLEVRGLDAGYGRISVLHSVDLAVAGGEAVCVIGSNGAGKTTLLRTISGLMTPTRGQILLEGEDVTHWSIQRRVAAGLVLVPEGRQVFDRLAVSDNLLLGSYRRRDGRRATLEHVYELFPVLAERAGQLAGTLSGGQQQQLAIGRALMGRPRVLLLDEPSLGLAPLAVREVTDKLAELAVEGTTLALVEQNANAAFRVGTRGYLLDRGSVIVEGDVDKLRLDSRVQSAYLGETG